MKKYIVAAVFLLTACGGQPSNTNATPLPTDYESTRIVKISDSLYRAVDKDMHVVCYMYYGSGISCLKLDEDK